MLSVLTHFCTFMLAVLAVYAIVQPFFVSQARESITLDEDIREMDRKKEIVFDQLKDLEADRLGGRVSQSEFASLKASLLKEAAEILQRIEIVQTDRSGKHVAD